MFRKFFLLSGFLTILSFASLTYADPCPNGSGYDCFPADYMNNLWQQNQSVEV